MKHLIKNFYHSKGYTFFWFDMRLNINFANTSCKLRFRKSSATNAMKKTRHIGIWFLVTRSSSRVDLLKIKVIRRGFLQCIELHYFGLLLYIKDSKKVPVPFVRKKIFPLWKVSFLVLFIGKTVLRTSTSIDRRLVFDGRTNWKNLSEFFCGHTKNYGHQ